MIVRRHSLGGRSEMFMVRVFAFVLLTTLLAFSAFSDSKVTGPSAGAAAEMYGKLPLHFEANSGQVPSEVRYLTRTPGATILLTDESAVIHLARVDDDASDPKSRRSAPPDTSQAVVTMKLAGAKRPE